MSSKKSDAAGRGRPRGFDEAEALVGAMEAFWRTGYGGTSLDDLVEATGASRASLYATFGDKLDLFKKCLKLYGDRYADRIDAALASDASGRERLRTILEASAERLSSSGAPPGCLRCNSTLELAGVNPVFADMMRDANQAFLDSLSRIVERAARDGEIPLARVGALSLFFTCVVNGMVTMAKSGASRADLDVVIENALSAWPTGR